MQSYIVNIPDSKMEFFLELMDELKFEVLEMSEQNDDEIDEEEDTTFDPFLDWEEERKVIKDSRKKK